MRAWTDANARLSPKVFVSICLSGRLVYFLFSNMQLRRSRCDLVISHFLAFFMIRLCLAHTVKSLRYPLPSFTEWLTACDEVHDTFTSTRVGRGDRRIL